MALRCDASTACVYMLSVVAMLACRVPSGDADVNGFCPGQDIGEPHRDLERKLADFQAYYNAARSHASLEGHTPLTFTSRHTVARVELTMCVGSPTARTSFSCQWQPDNEFETDRPRPAALGSGCRESPAATRDRRSRRS